jgi:hypothetical protein
MSVFIKIRAKISDFKPKVDKSYLLRIMKTGNSPLFAREEGSVAGMVAGLMVILFLLIMMLGIFNYLHISLGTIETWFRNFGLGVMG